LPYKPIIPLLSVPITKDAVAEPLVTLLGHQSHTVRVTASWALQCFCHSTPLRLPKTILIVLEMLQRDLNSLLTPASVPDVPLRALGHAYGLAALIAIIPERPLYVSYDVSAKVLDMAIQLLKRAGEHDVNIARVEIEVAWNSISSLMSLGPNFVRPHLPQLLVLWRNALPKPTSKDSAVRTADEWAFLLHVRECALGAILSFLRRNSSVLVTLDVARRIASVLNNALSFANSFTSQSVLDIEEASLPSSSHGFLIRDREALLRRSVYECFTALGFSSIMDSTQSILLQSVVSLFASPDGYAGSAVQAAIASSAGTFTSVWQSVDGYAYGVTYIELRDNTDKGIDGDFSIQETDRSNRDTIEVANDALVSFP
jgi:HEAT repeat-containing protein 5